MARYGLGLLITNLRPETFPLGTLIINVVGSFVIGVFAGINDRFQWANPALWLLLATGLCGGFTTFSAFSLENVRLLQHNLGTQSLLYIAASIIAGIGACYLGYLAAK